MVIIQVFQGILIGALHFQDFSKALPSATEMQLCFRLHWQTIMNFCNVAYCSQK